MTLSISLHLEVDGEPDELEAVERMRADMERRGLENVNIGDGGIDLTHLNDICAILADVRQVMARARAARKR